MKPTDLRFEGPWGHCALLLAFITFTAWYTLDASTASSGYRDLLLIGPVGAIALLLCAGLLVREALRLRIRRAPADGSGAGRQAGFLQEYGAPAVMAALAIYVILMPFIGFDTATFLFTAGLMVIQGERKAWVILVFSTVVTVLVMLVMLKVLSVDTPTLVMEHLVD